MNEDLEERLFALEKRAFATQNALLIIAKAISDELPEFVVHDGLKRLAAAIPDVDDEQQQEMIEATRELLLNIIVGSGPAKGI